MRHLGVPIRDMQADQRKQRIKSGEQHLTSTPLIPSTPEDNNENLPPPINFPHPCSAFTPVQSSPATPVLSRLQHVSSPEWDSCLPPVTTSLKHSSVDSCFSTPSSASMPSFQFSNSASSLSNTERSYKRLRTASPGPIVWRPYLD